MRRAHVREGAMDLVIALYRALLITYPRSFRREYGAEMVQVFRTACRLRHAGGLTGFLLRSATDLLRSAGEERVLALRLQQETHPSYVYAIALSVSALTGYVHMRSDADGLSVALLLVGTFACGVACPVAAWRWAILAGLGLPLALLLAHGFSPPPVPRHDADMPLPASVIGALAASYAGVLSHHLFPRMRLAKRPSSG